VDSVAARQELVRRTTNALNVGPIGPSIRRRNLPPEAGQSLGTHRSMFGRVFHFCDSTMAAPDAQGGELTALAGLELPCAVQVMVCFLTC
jgi:hypothetical protein